MVYGIQPRLIDVMREGLYLANAWNAIHTQSWVLFDGLFSMPMSEF